MARNLLQTLLVVLVTAAVLPGCRATRRPIVLDSTPRGASVLIDGVDSGHCTPCAIQLPDARRTVEFQLDGYQPERRSWRIGSRSEVVFYRDAITDDRTWAFPLWLGAGDFFFPVKTDDGEMPHRIHVRLSRQREPLANLR